MGSGNSMHDHGIRRDAGRGGKTAIALRRRHAASLADELLGDTVELAGRDARPDVFADECDRLGDELARPCHGLDLLR